VLLQVRLITVPVHVPTDDDGVFQYQTEEHYNMIFYFTEPGHAFGATRLNCIELYVQQVQQYAHHRYCPFIGGVVPEQWRRQQINLNCGISCVKGASHVANSAATVLP